MMRNLIQPNEVSEQILIKIVSEITSKYELRQKINLPTFIEDSNIVVQEMMLYNSTIEQLFTNNNMLPIKILTTYHRQLYNFIQFLIHVVQKMYNKSNIHISNIGTPSNLCSNCQHFIHQRNVKNMQREILDYHKYSIQRFDQQLRQQFEENQGDSDQEQKMIISEQYFRRKMGKIQKSMNERQNNLLECIDDFETLRVNLLLQVKKQEFEGEVKQFNIREYISEISQHLLQNLRKLEDKILHFRKANGSFEDQASQTSEQPEKNAHTQRSQLQKQNNKIQAENKKLSESKIKLEDLCKKYQSQLRDSLARVEAIEAQNKKIREEIFSEKLKGSHRQKLLKNAEKNQQKASKQKQDEDKHRKQTAITHFQNLLSESGEFANEFSLSIKENLNGKQFTNRYDEVAPIIKAAFKKTLDRYTSQKSVMIMSSEKRKAIKNQSAAESPKEKRRSKDKTLRIQFQLQGSRQSRFSVRKIQKDFTIRNGKSQKSLNSQTYVTVKTVQNELEGKNNGQKRKKLAKLSIFSNLKEQNQQPSNRNFQKRRQTTQFYPQQISSHFLSTNILNGKPFKKSTFRRNKSQDDLQSLAKIEDSFKVSKVKGQLIDSVAVRKFFFSCSPSEAIENFREKNTKKFSQNSINHSKFISDNAHGEQKIQRHKIILTLEELSYLTALFSLLAKVHLVNPKQYGLLKDYILSTTQKTKQKQEQKSQSLIIRKMLSEIIFRHRHCHSISALCPHLNDFLKSIESYLLETQGQPIEKTKFNLIV